MQNLIPFNTIPKIPPSELGFVCKPELPPHINILFRARPPLQYIPIPYKGIRRKYTGIFDNGNQKNILSYFEKTTSPPKEEKDSKYVQKLKSIIQKLDKQSELNKQLIKEWNPNLNPNATSDPRKTIIVYKLDRNVDEKQIKSEFAIFGEIKKVRLIRNFQGKSRGYAFVEFAHSSPMKHIYKGKSKAKLGKKYYCVDHERGRRKENWLPRKFGGGKGENERDFPEEVYNDIKRIKKQFPNLVKGNKYEIEKGEINESDNSESYSRNNNKYIGNKRDRSRSYRSKSRSYKSYRSYSSRSRNYKSRSRSYSSRSRNYKSRSRSYRRRSSSRYYRRSNSENSIGNRRKYRDRSDYEMGEIA